MGTKVKALQWLLKAIGHGIQAICTEMRDALRDNGMASWSRYGSAIVVFAWCYVAISTKSIPERTEMVGVILAALYGANQLPKIAQAMAQAKEASANIKNPGQ